MAEACLRSGRQTEDVRLIAVTKYLNLQQTGEVLALGVKDLGESRVQDAAEKLEAFGHRATWHFIGHLQSNKVKQVVGAFAYIHSLDRLSLAEEIQRRSLQLGRPSRCFLQVNVSGEVSKFGIDPKNLLDFVEKLSSMDHVHVVGLMTMAPKTSQVEEVRPYFRALARLQKSVQALRIPTITAEHLSMGMSQDFEVAIEEGATMIRVGTALVGNGVDA